MITIKSKREIEYILQTKGVSGEIVAKYMSVISNDDELLSAETLAVKYMRGKDVDEKNLAKLYAFLARKGFTSEVIKEVLHKFKEIEE